MKFRLSLILFVVIAITFCLMLPPSARADGAATFKAKCAACHGADGQGKMGPALKGTTLTADQIVDMLTKGNDAKKVPHKKAVAGLTPEDAKAVADFVKALK